MQKTPYIMLHFLNNPPTTSSRIHASRVFMPLVKSSAEGEKLERPNRLWINARVRKLQCGILCFTAAGSLCSGSSTKPSPGLSPPLNLTVSYRPPWARRPWYHWSPWPCCSRAPVLTAVSVALAVSDAVDLPIPTTAAKLPICTALPVAIAIPDAINLPVPTATSSCPHRPRHPDRSHRWESLPLVLLSSLMLLCVA